MRKTRLVVVPPGPERPEMTRDWIHHPYPVRAEINAGLNVADQTVDVVDEETGKLHHVGRVRLSGQIHLSVVVHENGRIGLIYIRREKVVPPCVAETFFAKNPKGRPGLEHVVGIEEYECPHGLALRTAEEVEEEMGLRPLQIVQIGYVKDSPPNGGNAHVLSAVKVGDAMSGKHAEAGEQIRHVEFFEPEDVRGVLAGTICGLTKAALWTFRSWGLDKNDPGTFWHGVASRL